MKKMIVSAFMLASMATTTHAQNKTTSASTTSTASQQDDAKTPIDLSKLPDAVKATLAGDAYKDWKATTSWEANATPIYYIVELKKDDKTTTIKIGQDGKVK